VRERGSESGRRAVVTRVLDGSVARGPGYRLLSCHRRHHGHLPRRQSVLSDTGDDRQGRRRSYPLITLRAHDELNKRKQVGEQTSWWDLGRGKKRKTGETNGKRDDNAEDGERERESTAQRGRKSGADSAWLWLRVCLRHSLSLRHQSLSAEQRTARPAEQHQSRQNPILFSFTMSKQPVPLPSLHPHTYHAYLLLQPRSNPASPISSNTGPPTPSALPPSPSIHTSSRMSLGSPGRLPNRSRRRSRSRMGASPSPPSTRWPRCSKTAMCATTPSRRSCAGPGVTATTTIMSFASLRRRPSAIGGGG
jgi:hypothetical protein